MFIEKCFSGLILEETKKENLLNLNSFEDIIDIFPKTLKDLINNLKNNPERTDYHPEGNTYNHTKKVVEKLIPTKNINLILAGVFHDLGKLYTTEIDPRINQPSSHGHENISAKIVSEFRSFINSVGGNADIVYQIVLNHMKIKNFKNLNKKEQEWLKSSPHFGLFKTFTIADDMVGRKWEF